MLLIGFTMGLSPSLDFAGPSFTATLRITLLAGFEASRAAAQHSHAS